MEKYFKAEGNEVRKDIKTVQNNDDKLHIYSAKSSMGYLKG